MSVYLTGEWASCQAPYRRRVRRRVRERVMILVGVKMDMVVVTCPFSLQF